jgi:hypothetical protein
LATRYCLDETSNDVSVNHAFTESPTCLRSREIGQD